MTVNYKSSKVLKEFASAEQDMGKDEIASIFCQSLTP